MKRYFTFQTPPTGYTPRGGYHYMSLPGSGYICVLMEGSVDKIPADWTELPHLLESMPAKFDGIQHTLGAPLTSALSAMQPLASVSSTDNTFQVAKKLAAVNILFHP